MGGVGAFAPAVFKNDRVAPTVFEENHIDS